MRVSPVVREDGSGTNTYNIEAISSSDSDTSDTEDDDHAYSQIAQPPPPDEEENDDHLYAHILQPPAERVPAIEYRPLTPNYHPIYPTESAEAIAAPYSPEFRPDDSANNINNVEDAEMEEEFSDMEALSSDSSSSSSSNSLSSNSMNNDEPLAGFSPNLEPVDAIWSSSSSSSSTSNSESNSDSDIVVPNVIEAEGQDAIW